jgi:hypothetical protein
VVDLGGPDIRGRDNEHTVPHSTLLPGSQTF